MLDEIPLNGIEHRAQQLMLHSRINYAYRRDGRVRIQCRSYGDGLHAALLRARSRRNIVFPCLNGENEAAKRHKIHKGSSILSLLMRFVVVP